MTSVDVCRLNKYDNPDLVYGRHDGTIIKRLFSAFSFRPTVVATLPVTSLFAYNPYSQNMRPTVTSIPMINVRLSNFGNIAAAAAAAAATGGVGGPLPLAPTVLSAALSQTNQFLEGNAIVNRHTSVMFSREILVFYVDRRSYVYTAGTSVTNLARLPTSIAGFERINDIALPFEDQINIKGVSGSVDDTFDFCSAVIADVNTNVDPTIGGNYVVGSSAIIKNPSPSVGRHFYHYTPSTCISRNDVRPIIDIPLGDITPTDPGVQTLLTTRAVIFIYTNPNYKDAPISF
jgi:hypothetical protein